MEMKSHFTGVKLLVKSFEKSASVETLASFPGGLIWAVAHLCRYEIRLLRLSIQCTRKARLWCYSVT
uniref:Uncharacterized protein n=1 Tax=Anguilla anguilla TaxID=7936 RepID=A0A0E9VHH7_ANGAN